MAAGQLADERVRQPRQGVVDRVADMAMIDADAIRRRHELDDLTGMQRPIDRIERAGARDPMLDDRVGHATERAPDGVDPRQVALRRLGLEGRLRAESIGALVMDDAPIHEPRERVIEGREPLARETILAIIGVQEVEGPVERDLVSVAQIGRAGLVGQHRDNHFTTVDRLRASAYADAVTIKHF